MSAQKYDFPIEQGTSFRLALTYKDKDGNIVDLTDWCARLIWQTNTGVTQVFTTENTDLSLYSFTIDGSNGKLIFLLPASITNSFNFSLAKYDLELRSPEDLYEGGESIQQEYFLAQLILSKDLVRLAQRLIVHDRLYFRYREWNFKYSRSLFVYINNRKFRK
jgi:hypothetical protein